VIQFVDTFKSVWICGVAGDDSPLKLNSTQAARAAMAQGGFPLGFIMISAETGKALYVNNDDCSWLCGLSLAERSLYQVGK